jgi:hypothetical protein
MPEFSIGHPVRVLSPLDSVLRLDQGLRKQAMRHSSARRAGVRLSVSSLQHVMLALDKVSAHIQPLRGGDVAGLLEVTHNQASQQAQTERMKAVRFARRFDFGVRAADAPGRGRNPRRRRVASA